jgi:hypothetical protein
LVRVCDHRRVEKSGSFYRVFHREIRSYQHFLISGELVWIDAEPVEQMSQFVKMLFKHAGNAAMTFGKIPEHLRQYFLLLFCGKIYYSFDQLNTAFIIAI